MPKLTIDGKEVEAADGLNLIQAAEQVGIEIPHYCYHPALSIPGNCRMCLVEIEKAPKLQISCNTKVAEGMVVHTRSDKAKAAQRAVLEFLLINHPIDCPICDQAGECKLQDYYMDYDEAPSRFPLAEKNRKGKALDVGSDVMLDQERCILCARCTRFFDEVTKTSELAIFERGDHNRIDGRDDAHAIRAGDRFRARRQQHRHAADGGGKPRADIEDAIVAAGIVDSHWRFPAAHLEELAVLVPALNRAKSTPANPSSVKVSTGICVPWNLNVLPFDRAEANSLRLSTGKSLCSSNRSSSVPTAPVAPTIAK